MSAAPTRRCAVSSSHEDPIWFPSELMTRLGQSPMVMRSWSTSCRSASASFEAGGRDAAYHVALHGEEQDDDGQQDHHGAGHLEGHVGFLLPDREQRKRDRKGVH